MCGLFGVIGSGIIKEDLGVFHTLAFVNQLRGMHSTGVARVFRHGKPEIRKDTIPAMYFLGDKRNESITRDVTALAVMGHNRSATVGDAGDIAGAHPFETDSYIGFHNGTLVEKRFTNNEKFLTDSESLWNEIEEKGDLGETVAKLSKDSAFALAYYNKKTKMVGFVRNGKRPLAVAAHATREVIYYSSDILDLEYALDRMNVDAATMNVGSWRHILCNPVKINFIPKTEEFDGRKSCWTVEEITPAPEEDPKPPITEFFYGQGTYSQTSRSSRFQARCEDCRDEVDWKDPDCRPRYVRGFGAVCHKCVDKWERMGVDFNQPDVDMQIMEQSNIRMN